MTYLNIIIDFYVYRIMYFFSKSSKDNAWNIERSKNLLSLYAIIFSSVLFLGIFELLNITRILREYSMLHNESSKLLKLLLAVLSYFIFSSYFSKKVRYAKRKIYYYSL